MDARMHTTMSYARSTRSSASHSLSVPRHNLSLVLVLFVSQLTKYGIPYRLAFCSLKHSLHLGVI